jgi:putative photosynthetic complex assembly protein 2
LPGLHASASAPEERALPEHSLDATLARAVPPVAPDAKRITIPMAIGTVVLFWWLATGVIVAVERNDTTRLIGVIVASWLAVLAGVIAGRVRHDETPRGALAGFAAGALFWLWLSALFYAGAVVGPSVSVPASLGAAPSIPLAIRAIVATGFNDLLSIAVIGILYLVPGRNRMAWQTVGLFWVVQQLAKLNVFFGVVNAGVRFLPPRLAFLTAFFGPPRVTPLLLLSIVVALVVGVQWVRRARREVVPFEQCRWALLAVLALLAAFEYLVLALPTELPLWDAFLRARGG